MEICSISSGMSVWMSGRKTVRVRRDEGTQASAGRELIWFREARRRWARLHWRVSSPLTTCRQLKKNRSRHLKTPGPKNPPQKNLIWQTSSVHGYKRKILPSYYCIVSPLPLQLSNVGRQEREHWKRETRTKTTLRCCSSQCIGILDVPNVQMERL